MVATKRSELKEWCRVCKFEGILAFCDECEDGVYFRESSQENTDYDLLTENREDSLQGNIVLNPSMRSNTNS